MLKSIVLAMGCIGVLGVVQAQEKVYRYEPLVRITNCEGGTCEVKAPGATAFKAVTNGKAYPYDSAFRLRGGAQCRIYFANAAFLNVTGDADFSVKTYDEGYTKVGLCATLGEYAMSIHENLPANTFLFETPNGTFTSLLGRSEISLKQGTHANDLTKSYDLAFRQNSGSGVFQGLHYKIPEIKISNAFTCEESQDHLATFVIGTLGEMVVQLPNGTGNDTEFPLSVGAEVKIRRVRANAGRRWVVSVFTALNSGTAKNFFVYADGNPDIKTGELIDEILPQDDAEADEESTEETESEESVEDEELVI